MTSLAQRCGLHDAARAAACDALRARVREADVRQVRVAWGDLHGWLRGKTLMPHALDAALMDGVGLVGTLLLKDTSDRTAFKVFEPGGAPDGFGGAANLWLLPDPASFTLLPWAPGTAWVLGQPWFADGTPVLQDPRRVLQRAVARLADAGWRLRCGLEVEFHVYRIVDERLDPATSTWPPEPPAVGLIHPGWQLLSEAHADRVAPVFDIVRDTALGLGLPLRSLEIELGPSQVEAVFDAMDALDAADGMLRFRNGVQQALRRAGYHASFVSRPPFPQVMARGWHLHHSLVDAEGRNAFAAADAPLSATGRHWLAGLLAHAPGATVFGTSTTNGFGRFRPNALAPMQVAWGRDNRGAMLRVLAGHGNAASRIENRVAEPAANPYYCLASQILSGLHGIRAGLEAPAPVERPYDNDARRLPTSLGEAIGLFEAGSLYREALGGEFVSYLSTLKRAEWSRYLSTVSEWEQAEYFTNF